MKHIDIINAIEPFAEAKAYNPGGSSDEETKRTMNVKMRHIKNLRLLRERLLLEGIGLELEGGAGEDSVFEIAFRNIMAARDEAEVKAWDALSRYKFEMFGYWASAWVKYNQLMPKEHKLGNPFGAAVKLARKVKDPA